MISDTNSLRNNNIQYVVNDIVFFNRSVKVNRDRLHDERPGDYSRINPYEDVTN